MAARLLPTIINFAIASILSALSAELATAQTLQPQFTATLPELSSSTQRSTDRSFLAVLTQPVGPSGSSIAGFMKDQGPEGAKPEQDLPIISADLVRTLRDDPEAIIAELKTLSDQYDLVVAAAQNRNALAQRTLLAGLVLDQPSSQRLVEKLSSVEATAGAQVQSDIAESRRLLKSFT